MDRIGEGTLHGFLLSFVVLAWGDDRWWWREERYGFLGRDTEIGKIVLAAMYICIYKKWFSSAMKTESESSLRLCLYACITIFFAYIYPLFID